MKLTVKKLECLTAIEIQFRSRAFEDVFSFLDVRQRF